MEKQNLNQFSSIVILTGAGISAESGIKTFRASDGLWEDHRIEDVATPGAFIRDPNLVHKFYNTRREKLLSPEIAPNPAHYALAELEKIFHGEFTLVTQNIDNLHERAGSKNILHMHGELLKMRCKHTNQIYECQSPISVNDSCACCNQAGNLRPHIVWFEEMPLFMDEIYQAVESCDLFISIGTSGNVYPAAGLVQIANQNGAMSIEMNLEESNTASQFKNAIYGKASKILPNWLKEASI